MEEPKPPKNKKPKKSKKQQANTLEAEGQPEEQTKSKKNNGKAKNNQSKSKENKATEAEALEKGESAQQIELTIPLTPLKKHPKKQGPPQTKPPRDQTMRQWLEFVTGRQKEWKMSRKMQEAPKATTPILPSVPTTPVEAQPTLDLEEFAFLEPSANKQQREKDLKNFVHAV